MEYCWHVWADAPTCYLGLLDKLQKWTCWCLGPSLVASLEPLAHCENVASLSLFYRYLVLLPYFPGRYSCYSEILHDFLSPFLGVTRMLMPTVSFFTQPDLARYWPSFSTGITWFNFLIFKGGIVVFLIDCRILLSPFPYVTRMPLSTVSFLTQLDSGVLYL